MSGSSLEKCFSDAEDTGLLRVSHKGLKCFPNFVDEYDLVDVLVVDISKNRFLELPQELLSFVMVERMDCSSNYLKTLLDLSNLNALTYIDISQNQLQTLPIHICSLPLKILKASHNRISNIPCEIGLLNKLQAIDISCNELTNLPSTMGDLSSLRMLNVRRNKIVVLPDELSKLKNLCSLNFSCNRISSIPPAFRLISSLIELDLTNNPLTSPPAQICLKGRLHIVKFLSLAAQQQEKRWSVMNDASKNITTYSLNVENSTERAEVPIDSLSPLESSRNEEIIEKEFIDSPQGKVEEHKDSEAYNTMQNSPPKPKLPKKPTSLLSNQELPDKQMSSEKGKLTLNFRSRISQASDQSMDKTSLRNLSIHMKSKESDKSSDNKDDKEPTNDEANNIEARKEQLLKNKEEIIKSRQRLENYKSKRVELQDKTSPGSTSQTSTDSNQSDVPFEGIAKRGSLKSANRSKILRDGASNYTMRRFYDGAKEELEELEKLREAMETRLRIKLPDDLPASLSDGIVLCHLVNHLRKGTIQVIHVPSSGVPKLTMPKCQMNVDAFLDACRRVGVDKSDICTAPDILEEKSPIKLCRTVQSLLQALGTVQSHVKVTPSR